MAVLDIFTFPAHLQPLAVASESSKAPSSEADDPRYPKRKREEVKYYSSDEAEDSTDSESEWVTSKRPRTTTRPKKPLPPQKIFPFTSLPAELRNRIYEECFPDMPTLSEEAKHGERGTIWFRSKQRAYRRSVEQFFPEEEELEYLKHSLTYNRHRYRQRGTGRGRPAPPAEEDEDEEEMAGNPADKKLGLNILALNQAIYHEAAPMVYRQHLIFADAVALMAFAALLSPRTAKLIRHIEVRCWNLTRSRKSNPFTAMAMLAAKGVTNLEKFHINCAVGHYWSRNNEKSTPVPKRVARKVYRDCFLWLEAVGRAREMEGGSRWAGVDVLEIAESNYDYGRRYYAPPSERTLDDDMDEANEMFKKELKRLLRPTLG
ncbi:hypothetical protein K505DRAFT_422514 [Melanomma pulvis-pyrius CBS 109.77]|uniref:Uncharacterized protein n=1 Tax=Melanomma pulvis-pyrius CBS 109.77 TaxID=1314802 RepID=A0A6A6WQE9_9PLEO|nr:hypothetical protein K505DRAFT_422514 [Melanomma pulvis-pyrius CBS 109.77]